jgi:hypothetical protein
MRLLPPFSALRPFSSGPGATVDWSEPAERRCWTISEQRREQFRGLGYNRRRPFFPHRLWYLPKAAPDALRLSGWMLGSHDANRLWQILLHADPTALEGLPAELFLDDDLVWHRQHLQQPGHIAYACLALHGRDLYGLNYVSDVVQRIARRREHKTQIGTRFRGWPSLLLNSIMAFAQATGKRTVFSPTADWVLRHTDPARVVERELFDAVYDRSVEQAYLAQRTRNWWAIDVAANRERIVLPMAEGNRLDHGRTIAVCHDIERGWGHRLSHPQFAAEAEQAAPAALPVMLEVERQLTVRASYHVVGIFYPEVCSQIARDGHTLGFHSFDHNLVVPQLQRCREVDYRTEGYRPPQSRLTRELSDRNLCLHNFQWLASAAQSIGTPFPRLKNRVVKIPIALDDYPLFTGAMSYETWEAYALHTVRQNRFTALSLHDCYAAHWLPHYRGLLEKLLELGELRTLNDIANDLWLASAT